MEGWGGVGGGGKKGGGGGGEGERMSYQSHRNKLVLSKSSSHAYNSCKETLSQ